MTHTLILSVLLSGLGIAGQQLPPDTHILDLEQPVTSLAELTSRLEGKPIYLDRWASWCQPCLNEFRYGKPVHKFLDEHDIAMVYLNSDKELTTGKWIELINEYNLKGYHLRLSTELKTDLTRLEHYIPRIPQYMIISKEGKVLTNQALRPSQKRNLFRQLEELIIR